MEFRYGTFSHVRRTPPSHQVRTFESSIERFRPAGMPLHLLAAVAVDLVRRGARWLGCQRNKSTVASCCKCHVRVDSTCKGSEFSPASANEKRTGRDHGCGILYLDSLCGEMLARGARTNLAAGAGFLLVQHPACMSGRQVVSFSMRLRETVPGWVLFIISYYQQQAVIIYQLAR